MLLPSTDNHVLQKLSDMMVDQYVWKDLACFMTAGFRENVTGDSPNRLRPLLNFQRPPQLKVRTVTPHSLGILTR